MKVSEVVKKMYINDRVKVITKMKGQILFEGRSITILNNTEIMNSTVDSLFSSIDEEGRPCIVINVKARYKRY